MTDLSREDLNKLTIVKLNDLAKEHNINKCSNKKKDVLVDYLYEKLRFKKFKESLNDNGKEFGNIFKEEIHTYFESIKNDELAEERPKKNHDPWYSLRKKYQTLAVKIYHFSPSHRKEYIYTPSGIFIKEYNGNSITGSTPSLWEQEYYGKLFKKLIQYYEKIKNKK